MGSLTGLVSTLGLQMLSLIVGGIFLLGGIGSWWMTTMAPSYYAALNASDVSSEDTLDGDLSQMINSQNAVLVGVAMERSFKENINGNSISPNSFNLYDSNDPVWQVVLKKLKAGNNGSIPDPGNANPMQCAYFIHTVYEVADHPLPASSPTAIGYWNNENVRSAFQSHGWKYIDNGKGVPSPGDLVILDGPTPGAAGHIAMVVGVDAAQGGSDGYVYMVQANAPNNYVKNAATHLTFMRWPLTSDKYMKSGWSHYTVMGFINNQTLSRKWGDPFHASSGSDIRAKIVAAARKEYARGVHETGVNCNPYGPCEEWCALFASWTWRQAGININIAYVPNYQDYGQKHGTLHKGLSNPQPGDAIIFHTPGHSYTHVGIIVEVHPNGEVISIEGNHRDRVDKVGPYRLNGMRPGNEYAEAIVSPPIPSGGPNAIKTHQHSPMCKRVPWRRRRVLQDMGSMLSSLSHMLKVVSIPRIVM
ncbi:CHAP domain-containing protein [Ktedonospora formicarum]|uniref:Peptidase C51 domain-containing protein n=1 Tax=Ktedonospora formicarum TaxID=2778364 RepID=A0A8J3ICW4_9CHLR|nr:CHAP domain-containing protein [Ktedonospora formicarum]GHO50422.1 hypothetical protein KSX_85850 [Ktedonospora formicarum]